MGALAEKIAIITGASSGIGRAAALLFAAEGAALVLVARRRTELEQLVAEIGQRGGRAIAIIGDVSDETIAQRAVGAAVASYGGLDIAFNNAGTLGEMGPTPEVSPNVSARLTTSSARPTRRIARATPCSAATRRRAV